MVDLWIKQTKKGKQMEDFDRFWAAYPRKIAKADARKAWMQTEKIRPDIETILKAILTGSRSEQWREGRGQFIPYPATWLRGERWEDVHEVSLPDVVNSKPWHETAAGIEAKGRELGITPDTFASWPEFKQAVMHKTMRAA
jgi:hypothetical protein